MVTTGPVTQLRPGDEVSAPVEPRAELDWPKVRGYAVHEVVGTGGMGVVFRATHRELQRVVALKMLMAGSFNEDESRDRFRSEAETVASLQHPNIIQVFEIGTVDPLPGEQSPNPFIALEFVDGGNLGDKLKVPQPPRVAAELVEKLARAVQVAHTHGIIHRDLKPANVLLTSGGEPKIADFGLAKRLDAPRDNNGRFVTLAGTVMGTPEYMAPEQVAGDGPAASMDVYALGVILYELLTTRIPHHGATPADTMYMTRFEEPVSPRRLQPTLPRDIDTICMTALSKSPLKRYPSAEALADDLRRWLDGRPIAARPVSAVGRAVRWGKRNPAVAALSVLVVLLAAVGVSGIVWKWREARAAAATAERNAQSERWGRYRSEMIAASSALRVSEVAGARRALATAPEEFRDWEWRFFTNQLEGQSRVLVLDSNDTQRAHFTRDRRRVVYADVRGEVSLRDLTTGRLEWSGLKLTHWNSMHIDPDANRLTATLADDSVEVWSLDPKELLMTVPGKWGRVWAATFSSDGKLVLTATNDRVVRFWEAKTGKLVRESPVHKGYLGRPEFSPDLRRYATSGGEDKTVRVWDTQTGDLLLSIDGHDKNVASVQFSPDGTRIVTNEHYPTNTVWIWDAATGKKIADLRSHSNQVGDIRFSPTGHRMATSSMDQTTRLWDRDGNPVAVLRGHKGRVNTSAFSPDGSRVATAGMDRTIRLWDAANGDFLGVVFGHTGDIHRVEFNADGSEILSVASDGTLRSWDVRKIEVDGVIGKHASFAYSVAYHPDGKRALSAAWDGTAKLWDVDTGRELRSYPHDGKAPVMSVGIHSGGRWMATLARDKKARLWDIETGELLHAWKADGNDWRDSRLAFSPVGDLLATCEQNGSVRLFDVRTRAELPGLPSRSPMIVADVAFRPDGKHLAVGSYTGEARVWDVATRTEVVELIRHKDPAYAVGYSRDGTALAVGAHDGTVRVYDGNTYEKRVEMKPEARVHGVAFNKEGTRLAAACADNTIRFFDVKSGDEVGVIRGHTDYVHQVAFSPDGRRLVSASGDFTLRLWDSDPRAK